MRFPTQVPRSPRFGAAACRALLLVCLSLCFAVSTTFGSTNIDPKDVERVSAPGTPTSSFTRGERSLVEDDDLEYFLVEDDELEVSLVEDDELEDSLVEDDELEYSLVEDDELEEISSPGPSTLGAGSSDLDGSEMLSVEPFIGTGATVRGTVNTSLQAELELEETVDPQTFSGAAGAFRALLHGRKNPKKYPMCGSCRYVRCTSNRSYCSGHCRQKRKLFFCDTSNKFALFCPPRDYDDDAYSIEAFLGDPPDRLGDYDSAVVTAEAPYVGCAMIAGKATGCPAIGTLASVPGHGTLPVLSSFCRAEYYVPKLYMPECSVSPLWPFGVCECWYRVRVGPRGRFGPGSIRAPCRTTELLPGSGVGGPNRPPSEDDIVVLPGGNVTVTRFSDFIDPDQGPRFAYNVTASVLSTDVAVNLSIYPGQVGSRFTQSNVLRDGVEISDDYDYDPDPAAEVFDYVSKSVGDGGAAVEGVERLLLRPAAARGTTRSTVEGGGGFAEGSSRPTATVVVEP